MIPTTATASTTSEADIERNLFFKDLDYRGSTRLKNTKSWSPGIGGVLIVFWATQSVKRGTWVRIVCLLDLTIRMIPPTALFSGWCNWFWRIGRKMGPREKRCGSHTWPTLTITFFSDDDLAAREADWPDQPHCSHLSAFHWAWKSTRFHAIGLVQKVSCGDARRLLKRGEDGGLR